MIYLKQTKNKLGVILSGDYGDLISLYDTITDILEDSNLDENSKNFGYSFIYDLRKAYEGNRLVIDNNIYGVNLLWVSFLLQIRFYRSLCAFIPTTKKIQSDLYKIEYLVEDLIKSIDGTVYSILEKNWFNCPIFFPDDYLFEYINYLDYKYYHDNKMKFKNLPEILFNYIYLSDDYKKFSEIFIERAKEENTETNNIYYDYEFPPEEEW